MMTLTRTQILKLAILADKFKEVDWFTLESSSKTSVKFKAFANSADEYDVVIDITEIGD